jgi:hypothetical protein
MLPSITRAEDRIARSGQDERMQMLPKTSTVTCEEGGIVLNRGL